jgi:hypothetical protein
MVTPMYIRQTKTSGATSGEAYFTFRLVASKRIGGKVRQQTLLNLGRTFSLPREQWPVLCSRIEQIISGQISLTSISTVIEALAQQNVNASWSSLREIFSAQQRVTATFTQKDGRTLHVRKTTLAEPKLQALYDALSLSSTPVGPRKYVS